MKEEKTFKTIAICYLYNLKNAHRSSHSHPHSTLLSPQTHTLTYKNRNENVNVL